MNLLRAHISEPFDFLIESSGYLRELFPQDSIRCPQLLNKIAIPSLQAGDHRFKIIFRDEDYPAILGDERMSVSHFLLIDLYLRPGLAGADYEGDCPFSYIA